jgi:hypothetical protein
MLRTGMMWTNVIVRLCRTGNIQERRIRNVSTKNIGNNMLNIPEENENTELFFMVVYWSMMHYTSLIY